MPLPLATLLPFEGIRVLDITNVWAGPHCTMLLADWGAEVIRVESTQVMAPNTRGHMVKVAKETPRLRKNWQMEYPDWDPGERPYNRYPIFQSHGRNKKGMTVDLRTEAGQHTFRQLIAVTDVFVENNVPQTIEKLHLTYEELRRVRPDLIMLRMPAYGLSGPYKDYRSFGMQLEGTAGHTHIRGYADMDATSCDDVYMGDAAAGVSGAFAVAMALRHRRRTGKGQQIELAQVENFLPYLADPIMDYTMNRRVWSPMGNRHPSMAPHGVYRCRGEDRWVAIAVANDAEWRALLHALGDPPWAGDARFATSLARWRNQDALDPLIEAWTSERDAGEAMRSLQAHGVRAGHVMDDRDLDDDPHINAAGFFQQLTHADAGMHRYPGLMWTAAETPNAIRTPPVRLGEHNAYVYLDLLGVAQAEYNERTAGGEIGEAYAAHVP